MMKTSISKMKTFAVLTSTALLLQLSLTAATAANLPKNSISPVKKLATTTKKVATTTKSTKATSTNAATSSWKWKIDGADNKNKISSSIKSTDDLLVSLKELAKALGIPLKIDAKTKTVYLGKLPAELNPVATYKVGKTTKTVTEKQLNDYIAYRVFLNGNLEQFKAEEDFQKDMIKYIILNDWATAQASKELLEASKTFAKNTIASWNERMKGDEGMRAAWNEMNLPINVIEQFLIANRTAFDREKTLITENELNTEYDKTQSSGDFTTADVRHILIQTNNPQTGEQLRTKEDALTKIKEIQERLKTEDFATVAKSASEDPGSASNGGLYTNAEIKSFVSAFKKATHEQPLNQVGEPVETEFGYHLILVEKRTIKALSEVRESLVNQVAENRLNKLFDDNLKGIMVKLELPKKSFQIK